MGCRLLRAGWPLLLLGMLAIAVLWSNAAQAQAARASWGAKEGQACIECHSVQNAALVEEWRLGAHGQKGSHHAKAGQILAPLDNFLGEVLGGPPAVAAGCFQCHGSQIRVLPGGKFDPATWPNTGIGRINPDGTWGSCSACHTRHRFSRAQAREPQTCGKCHLGPDHPQIEIYQESKHGILWEANKHNLNIEREKWTVGVDYTAAPTCATGP